MLDNDSDIEGDELTAVLVSSPSNAASFSLGSDGHFTYTHDGSGPSSDTFRYKANDGTSDSNVVTVTITSGVQDTEPPVFGAIVDITTTATAPDGATVSYTVPSATDNVDPSPSVACSPTSGSQFALGDTTVSCTATDASGNSAIASFTVTVTLTAQAFDGFVDIIKSLGLQSGIENSLIVKIDSASSAFDRDNLNAAINVLGAFKNHVSAQDSKKINSEDANLLRDLANLLINHISTL